MEEKDILNSTLTTKFDELIEDYVVCEKNKANTMFKRVRTNQSEFIPNFLPPNMPPRPPYPGFNYSVFLSRRIYWQMVTLIDLYEQLRGEEKNNISTFNNLISQLELLRVTMYNIFRRLSGQNFIFGSAENISLSGDYCADLVTTNDYLTNLNRNLFYLQRLIDIPDINRQLIIMLATISSQQNTLNSLINDNC